MKIGVSSYSFQQYINKGLLDHISLISKAAELGFEALEYTELPGNKSEQKELAEKIKEEAKKCGIELSAYVVGANLYRDDENELKKEVGHLKDQVDIASALGVKLFRHDILMTPALPSGTTYKHVLDKVKYPIREVTEYAEKLGIKTMTENHGRIFQDPYRLEDLIYSVDRKNYGLLVDIGNFLCADEEPYKCISRLANLAFHVHFKDFITKDYYNEPSDNSYFRTRGGNYLRGTAVGHGAGRTEQCLHALKEAGYDGFLDIEFEGPEDCIEELKKGLAFSKSII